MSERARSADLQPESNKTSPINFTFKLVSSWRLPPDLSHMSQSLSHFSATVQLLQQKTRFGQPPVHRDAAQNLFVLSGLVPMSLQVSGARLVLRPECVHLQVSCTFDPARKSTDRPAAESILSRALIGSPMRVRSFCTCGNSFRPMTAA